MKTDFFSEMFKNTDVLSTMLKTVWSILGHWQYAVIFCIILVLGIVNLFRPQIKGWFGETLLHMLLKFNLDKKLYIILHNIMLPTDDGTTTQIDHIIVSQWGVFVIETKTYSGWIFGGEYESQWTVVHFRRKYRFQNPLRQNYKHIATLVECLGISKEFFKTIIAVSGEAKFKTEMPPEVMLFGDVAYYIKEHSKDIIIPPEQVQEVADAILEWQATLTKSQKAKHVQNLRKAHEIQKPRQEQLEVSLNHDSALDDKSPVCPRCGAPMVLRKRKADGLAFWGCSQFPKCRCVVNVESSDV